MKSVHEVTCAWSWTPAGGPLRPSATFFENAHIVPGYGVKRKMPSSSIQPSLFEQRAVQPVQPLRVLVGCESSGAVRDAFTRYGHVATSCDLLDSETPGRHYRGDVRDLLSQEWDLAIFHPPCTYLSSSGMHWTTRGLRDPQLTEDALAFVRLLMSAPIHRIAIENPVGVISTRIRPPDQYIQPYQFGENASKKTGLWLKNLPPLLPTHSVSPRLVKGKPRWGNQCDSGQNKLAPSETRWKERSKTACGIAEAMAQQWGGPVSLDSFTPYPIRLQHAA